MSIAYDEMADRLRFGQPDWLSKALTASGVSSNEMASYLGVSRTTISNYINGRTEPKLQTLRLWAMRTGVPLEYLLRGEVPETPNPGVPSEPAEKLRTDNLRPVAQLFPMLALADAA